MATRLDRLFTIIASSTSPAASNLAAAQLGDIQRVHPESLTDLLARLHPLVRSSKWETRISAAKALAAISKEVPHLSGHGFIDADTCPFLSAAGVKLEDLLEDHSSGDEDDEGKRATERSGFSPENLKEQKRRINESLGLLLGGQSGDSSSGLVEDNDLIGPHQGDEGVSKALSARERNLMRRQQRAAKRAKVENEEDRADGEGAAKKGRIDDKSGSNGLYEPENIKDDSDTWPFEGFCRCLFEDLKSPKWEIRHGAATALKELLMRHMGLRQRTSGNCGPDVKTEVKDEMRPDVGPETEANEAEFLQTAVVRLLKVLANDRFGDFVSDQMVAPVRESSAMALGAVLRLWPLKELKILLGPLVTEFMNREEWQCRHGGLLLAKYALLARTENEDQAGLLEVLFLAIMKGLDDEVDDVSAAAASLLVSVTESVVGFASKVVEDLVRWLWNSLTTLDDLSSATNPILKLLSSLLAKTSVRNGEASGNGDKSMSEKVPRILPFIHHPSSAVRQSALEALAVLTSQPEVASLFLPQICQHILRHCFQRSLLESNFKNLALIEKIWTATINGTPLQPLLMAACPLYGTWLSMIVIPPWTPIPANTLLSVTSVVGEDDSGRPAGTPSYLGGPESRQKVDEAERDQLINRARCLGARLLGKLACFIVQPVPGMDYSRDALPPMGMLVEKIVLPFLTQGKSAYRRFAVCQVISEWWNSYGEEELERHTVPASLSSTLTSFLQDPAASDFEELHSVHLSLQTIASSFLADLRASTQARHSKRTLSYNGYGNHENVDNLQEVFPDYREMSLKMDQLEFLSKMSLDFYVSADPQALLEKQSQVASTLADLKRDHLALTTLCMASVAIAVIDVGAIPLQKLNPVVKPLMEAVKMQPNLQLREQAVRKLPKLLKLCRSRNMDDTSEGDNGPRDPSEKILRNLVLFCSACDDDADNNEVGSTRIVSLAALATPENKGRNVAAPDLRTERLQMQSSGAAEALKAVVQYFGNKLAEFFPKFWHSLFGEFTTGLSSSRRELMVSIKTLETVSDTLPDSLLPTATSILPALVGLLSREDQSPETRHMTARCLAKLAKVVAVPVVSLVVQEVLPVLSNVSSRLDSRLGATEVVYQIVVNLEPELKIVPFIVLMIVPVMGAMSDPEPNIRTLVSRAFANMVRLIPLDDGKLCPSEHWPPKLLELRAQNLGFVDELCDVKKLQDYPIPAEVEIDAKFRGYQLEGVKWLAFLNRYKLHGILCDDMGLGKTLQAIAMVACDHSHKRAASGSSAGNVHQSSLLPSLVICPSTLCEHWSFEVNKFISNREILEPFVFGGQQGSKQRQKQELRSLISTKTEESPVRPDQRKRSLIVIASYDNVRGDAEFFAEFSWNYLILDEGHVIKSSKTKTTLAIKSLVANHRLILSGTPIQNNVLELWSLFDFLMPGFLGTERQFNANYSKPILGTRSAKDCGSQSSSKIQEKGALAIESLHRQVLPFILRRMKEQVLDDLPPKIIQDVYCNLSPLQVELYEDFVRRQESDKKAPQATNQEPQKAHVFQSLQYLKKVCNHPKLVLGSNNVASLPDKMLLKNGSDLDDIRQSGKLPALKELLLQCGIGSSAETESGFSDGRDSEGATAMSQSVLSQHRVLIFFQLKAMMDIVEQDLLKSCMPNVTYLRLDGSVAPSDRFGIVQKFNHDVTIDVLLLTTSVGGLGLNLTGADTVIFVEHDWNPMKDLQAMDRAHRIGQKKVVNVYRLISRHTVEEKILNLQQFKLKTARTVISDENSSIKTMATEQLFDLFSLKQGDNESLASDSSEMKRQDNAKGIKSLLESLPELWDEGLYEDEYNAESYTKSVSDQNKKAVGENS